MQLRRCDGMVPIPQRNPDRPWRFVPFPEYADFKILYRKTYPHTERDRHIIRMRANGATLQEIGQAYGLTRERVRQIEKLFLKRAAQGVAVGIVPTKRDQPDAENR